MKLTPELQSTLETFFAADPAVEFAYLFGSAARGETGPLSDLDLAVHLDRRLDPFETRLRMMESLAKALGHEQFDLIVLNGAPLLLRYEVIQSGILLKENRPCRVSFETETLRTYLDTAHLRQVQRDYIREQLERGDYFG